MSAAVADGWPMRDVVRARRDGVVAGAWPVRDALRDRRAASAVAPAGPLPLVAILCAPARGRAAASGVALALARAVGCPYALAGTVAGGAIGSLGAVPSARRAAATLHGRALPATASGRLVWLADRRSVDAADDVAAFAAALSAELGRAAAAIGAPAAVALPVARTAALDRVLAWHDAIVVVPELDTSETVVERALASLARLDRPVAAMAPPGRLSAALASAGVRAPTEAVDAVARLGFGAAARSRRRDG